MFLIESKTKKGSRQAPHPIWLPFCKVYSAAMPRTAWSLMISSITRLYERINNRPSLHHCPSLLQSVYRHHHEWCLSPHHLRLLRIPTPPLMLLPIWPGRITTRLRRKKQMISCWYPVPVSYVRVPGVVVLRTITRVMPRLSQYPSLPNGALFSRSEANLTLPLKILS